MLFIGQKGYCVINTDTGTDYTIHPKAMLEMAAELGWKEKAT